MRLSSDLSQHAVGIRIMAVCTYRRVGLVEGPVRIRIPEQNVLEMADVLHGQSEGVQLAQLKKKINK
jgi:hypothetical protein